MSQLSHFQSPIYYVLTNEAWFVAQVRNWRRTPSPSPRWKVLPTPLICCLKIVIRWCCALQTIRRLAFLFSTNLKHALSSWNLPQAIFIEKKKWSHFFFSSYPMCFVIRARLNQPRIALEWHQETDANDFSHITWLIFSYKRVCCECCKIW